MKTILSAAWLILRNDLRISYRNFRQRGGRVPIGPIIVVALLILLHGLFLFVFSQLESDPPLHAEGMAWSLILFFMFGMAVNHTISILFERADLDLLLASPLSPRAVLLSRLVTITVLNMAGVGILVLPLIHGIAFMHSPRYFLALPVWWLTGTLMTAVTITLTLGLVRLIGAKKARTSAQIFGALFGASFYLASQGANIAGNGDDSKIREALRFLSDYGSLTFVARAARGELMPLGVLMVSAVLAVMVTLAVLSRTFLQGVQDAAAISRKRQPSVERARFSENLFAVAIRKDVRLILRDPLLLSQVIPSVLYVIPGFFVLTRAPGLNALAPLALVLSIQCSMALTSVAANGEECLDLILASPTPELRLRVAKMFAGMALPCVAATLICIAMVFTGYIITGLVTLVFCLGNAAAASWIQVVRLKPRTRGESMRPAIPRSGASTAQMMLAFFLLATSGSGLTLFNHPRFQLVGIALLGANALSILACFTLVRLKEWSHDSWAKPRASTS